eukprot:382982_1
MKISFKTVVGLMLSGLRTTYAINTTLPVTKCSEMEKKHNFEFNPKMIPLPANHRFKMTMAVKYLYDYTNATTRKKYPQLYSQKGNNFHNISCSDTFNGSEANIEERTLSVQRFVDKYGLYQEN